MENPKQKSNIQREENKSLQKRAFMQMLPTSLKTNNERTMTTYALLDNDSQSTLIRDDFAQGLKLMDYN